MEKLRALLPPGMTLAELALSFIGSFPAVTCAIPGAKRAPQVEENLHAANLPPLSRELLASLAGLYEADVKPHVHQRW